MEGRRQGRLGHAPHQRPRRRVAAGRLARRQDAGLRRPVRRPHRGLHHAHRRRRPPPPHLGRRRHRLRRLDARRQGPRRHRSPVHPAADPPPRPRHKPTETRGRAPVRAAGPGGRRRLRRSRQDAVLHAPALPGQPHQALQGRHRPESLEVRRRRPGGYAVDRRLPRDQQEPHVVARPRLLPLRPRRRRQPLVHETGRERSQTAHVPRGLGRRPRLPLRRPRRLPARRRYPPI